MVIDPAFKLICGICHKPKRVIHETALWKIVMCGTCDFDA